MLNLPKSLLSQSFVQFVVALRTDFEFCPVSLQKSASDPPSLSPRLFWRTTLALNHQARHCLVENWDVMVFLTLHIRRTKRFWLLSRKITLFLRCCGGFQISQVQLQTTLWIPCVPFTPWLKGLAKIKTIKIFLGIHSLYCILCMPFQGFRSFWLWNTLLVRLVTPKLQKPAPFYLQVHKLKYEVIENWIDKANKII